MWSGPPPGYVVVSTSRLYGGVPPSWVPMGEFTHVLAGIVPHAQQRCTPLSHLNASVGKTVIYWFTDLPFFTKFSDLLIYLKVRYEEISHFYLRVSIGGNSHFYLRVNAALPHFMINATKNRPLEQEVAPLLEIEDTPLLTRKMTLFDTKSTIIGKMQLLPCHTPRKKYQKCCFSCF